MEAEEVGIAQPEMGNHRRAQSGGCSAAPSVVVPGDSYELAPQRTVVLQSGRPVLAGCADRSD